MRGVLTLACVVALCAPLTACGGRPAGTPASIALRARILAAALAQKSVHYADSESTQGDWPSQTVSDVSADSGRQQITITGTGVREKVDLRLVNGVIYVRGDSGGLQYILNLTEAQADKYAGRWISIPKGTGSTTGCPMA